MPPPSPPPFVSQVAAAETRKLSLQATTDVALVRNSTRAPLARPVQTVPPLQLKAEESLWVIERELPLASRSGLRAIKEAARREEEWFLEEVQRK